MHPPVDAPEEVTRGAGGGEEVVVAPWPQLLRARVANRVESSERYRWWVLWTVLAGLLSVNVTFTILAVALPRIADDMGTTGNTMTWVITAPLLLFGVAAPILGKTGDIWGHRRLYLVGLLGAALSAAASALAWNAGSLIAVRAIGGMEGAATGAASMALIFSVFEPGDRVKAMGWWSLVGAGGPVIGVAVGGPVIQAFGWRWVFAAQVPLILLAWVAAMLVLPETRRTRREGLDWLGAGTLTIAATSLLLALNRGPEWGWSHPIVLAGFVLSPLGALAFVAVERRATAPLLPLAYLRRRNFAAPIASQVFSMFAYMGGFILAPVLLSKLFGYDETQIGLIVIARPLAFSLTSPVAGYLAVRVGERTAAIAGTSAVLVSMFVFAAVTRDSSVLVVVAALMLSGVGLGVSSPSIASTVGNAVDKADLGIASASQQLLTQVGLVAGIQLMQTVQAARQPVDGLEQSFQAAYLVGAAVCLLGVVCASFVRSAEREHGAGAPAASAATAPG